MSTPDVTYDVHDAASISVEVNCAACGTYLGEQYKRGDGLELFKEHIDECTEQTEWTT